MTRPRPPRHPSDGHPTPARRAGPGGGSSTPGATGTAFTGDRPPCAVRARVAGVSGLCVGVGLAVELGLAVGPALPATASTPLLGSPTAARAALSTAAAARAAVVSVAAVALPTRATGWQWPLQPRPTVLGRFTAPAGPYAPGRRGVDLLAVAGQEVGAAGPGTVAFSGFVAGVPTVTVDHGTISTTYQPVLPLVHAGEVVAAGAAIGTVATWPQLCAPRTCLRWGAYEDGSTPRRYLDPLTLLGSGPVRLLPSSSGTLAAPPLHLPVTRVRRPSLGPSGAVPLRLAAAADTPAGSDSPARFDSTPAPSGVAGDGVVRATATAGVLRRPSARAAPSAARTSAHPTGSPRPRPSASGTPAPGSVLAADPPVAGVSAAGRDSGVAATAAVAGSVPPAVATSGDHAGLRRTVRQLGAVGLVATVLGAGGLLLPVGDSPLASARLRRRRGRSTGLPRRRP